MSTDWMPGKREDQLSMAKTWLAQLPQGGGAWNVSPQELDELTTLVGAAQTAIDAVAASGGSSVEKTREREAFAALAKYMRFIHQRKFFSPPMVDSDWIRLGLHPRDSVRTVHSEVTESVEFVIRLSSIRELVVDFWVSGASGKAKPSGYDGAVVIWGLRDTVPQSPEDLPHHAMASRTPYTIHFEESDRGKTVYIASAWQNERGILGTWSEYKCAVVP